MMTRRDLLRSFVALPALLAVPWLAPAGELGQERSNVILAITEGRLRREGACLDACGVLILASRWVRRYGGRVVGHPWRDHGSSLWQVYLFHPAFSEWPEGASLLPMKILTVGGSDKPEWGKMWTSKCHPWRFHTDDPGAAWTIRTSDWKTKTDCQRRWTWPPER